jgi:phage shock protein PspC (stress-responsive transcriptional regulator)
MADTLPSDALKKLVQFIIVLAIAATVLAFLVYFYIILPAKTGHVPPMNYGGE